MKRLLLISICIISTFGESFAKNEEPPRSIEFEYIAFLDCHIFVRLEKEGEKVSFYSCKFESIPRETPGALEEKRTKEVRKEIPLSHFDRIRDYLTKASTAELFRKGNGAGADGSGWSFSYIEGGYRQKFTVWTPTANEEKQFSEVIALGIDLIHITDYGILDSEIY